MYSFGGHSSAVVLETMGDFHSMFSPPMGSRLHTTWAEWEGGDVGAGMGLRSRRPTCIFAPPLCPAASRGGREGGRGRGVNRARKSRGGKGKRGFFANENGVQPYPGGERISLLSAGFFASVLSRFSSGMGFLLRRGPPTPVVSGDSFKSPRTEKGRGQEEYLFFSSNFDLEFREVRRIERKKRCPLLLRPQWTSPPPVINKRLFP